MFLLGQILLGVVIVLALFWLLPHRKLWRRFLAGRAALSDAQFLAQMAARPEQADALLAIRRAMAAVCGTSEELIHPNDRVGSLLALPMNGADPAGLVDELARQLGRPLEPVAADHLRSESACWEGLAFGELARRLAATLSQPVSPAG